MNDVAVERLALQMRKAIDAVRREELPFPMSQFPQGSCGDASLLLGAYLVDRGFAGFEYVCGERGTKRRQLMDVTRMVGMWRIGR
jgi:hypothetical protein